jgi:O-antigen ligase
MKNGIKTAVEWFVIAVIAIRPALDVFTESGIALGAVQVNPAAGISLLVLLAGGVWLSCLPDSLRKEVLSGFLPLVFMGWLVLLFGWALLPIGAAYLHGGNSLLGIREWIRLITIFMLFLVVYQAAREGKGRVILGAVAVSFLIPGLVGLYQAVLQEGALVRGVHRIQGTFVHPNPFAFYLVTVLGVSIWGWRWAGQSILWGILACGQFFLLIMTYSFTGAAMFGAMVASIISGGVSARVRWIGLGLLIVFVLIFLATPAGWQRVKMELQFDQLDEIERTGRETSSLTWRLLNWRFLYRQWQESPWIGHGLHSSKSINPMVKKGTGMGFDPHNDYVRFLAETGFLGLLLYLAFLAGTGYVVWTAYSSLREGPESFLALTALGLYAAWVVGSFNDNLITATAYQFILWAVFAVTAGIASQGEKERLF